MTEFNREHYNSLVTNEAKEAYLVECFGDDTAAREAALAAE